MKVNELINELQKLESNFDIKFAVSEPVCAYDSCDIGKVIKIPNENTYMIGF